MPAEIYCFSSRLLYLQNMIKEWPMSVNWYCIKVCDVISGPSNGCEAVDI